MTDKLLPIDAQKDFEALKLKNEHGAELWSSRDLQTLLGYGQWRRFNDAIRRAITYCELSVNEPDYHFNAAIETRNSISDKDNLIERVMV